MPPDCTLDAGGDALDQSGDLAAGFFRNLLELFRIDLARHTPADLAQGGAVEVLELFERTLTYLFDAWVERAHRLASCPKHEVEPVSEVVGSAAVPMLPSTRRRSIAGALLGGRDGFVRDFGALVVRHLCLFVHGAERKQGAGLAIEGACSMKSGDMSSALRTRDLEAAIDGIASSYDGPEVINNLESAALPNKRAVIDAFKHLKPAIYLGFYSYRSLTRENLRYALSEHLYPAFEILVEQIRRALTYDEAAGRAPSHAAGWSEEVVLQLLQSLPEIRRMLNTDVLAAYEGDPAARSIEEVVFSYPVIEAITAHRLAHFLYEHGVPMIPRIISEYAHGETGVDIHPGAKVGEGFFLDHGTGVVIGETAHLGRNVKMFQGVTLGALSTRRSDFAGKPLPVKRHPTIEDNVTIYAGATILGGETVIGAGSVIGGNVFLIKSVPPGSKILGRAKEEG